MKSLRVLKRDCCCCCGGGKKTIFADVAKWIDERLAFCQAVVEELATQGGLF